MKKRLGVSLIIVLSGLSLVAHHEAIAQTQSPATSSTPTKLVSVPMTSFFPTGTLDATATAGLAAVSLAGGYNPNDATTTANLLTGNANYQALKSGCMGYSAVPGCANQFAMGVVDLSADNYFSHKIANRMAVISPDGQITYKDIVIANNAVSYDPTAIGPNQVGMIDIAFYEGSANGPFQRYDGIIKVTSTGTTTPYTPNVMKVASPSNANTTGCSTGQGLLSDGKTCVPLTPEPCPADATNAQTIYGATNGAIVASALNGGLTGYPACKYSTVPVPISVALAPTATQAYGPAWCIGWVVGGACPSSPCVPQYACGDSNLAANFCSNATTITDSCGNVCTGMVGTKSGAACPACAITGSIVATSTPSVGGSDGTFTLVANEVGSPSTPKFNFALGTLVNTTGQFTGLAAGSYAVTITDLNNPAPACPAATTNIKLGEGCNIIVSNITPISPTNNGISNGSINVLATETGPSGGLLARPLTFALTGNGANLTNSTGSFTGLSFGTYSLSVADPADATCQPISTSVALNPPAVCTPAKTCATLATTTCSNNTTPFSDSCSTDCKNILSATSGYNGSKTDGICAAFVPPPITCQYCPAGYSLSGSGASATCTSSPTQTIDNLNGTCAVTNGCKCSSGSLYGNNGLDWNASCTRTSTSNDFSCTFNGIASASVSCSSNSGFTYSCSPYATGTSNVCSNYSAPATCSGTCTVQPSTVYNCPDGTPSTAGATCTGSPYTVTGTCPVGSTLNGSVCQVSPTLKYGYSCDSGSGNLYGETKCTFSTGFGQTTTLHSSGKCTAGGVAGLYQCTFSPPDQSMVCKAGSCDLSIGFSGGSFQCGGSCTVVRNSNYDVSTCPTLSGYTFKLNGNSGMCEIAPPTSCPYSY